MLRKRKKSCSIPDNPGKVFPKKRNKPVKEVIQSNNKVGPTLKRNNLLANLTQKNSSGANNWHTFIKFKTENSAGLKMDCSEEYTSETVVPARSNSSSKPSPRAKPTARINETIKSNKSRNQAKGFKPKDKSSNKLNHAPFKTGSNQPKKYSKNSMDVAKNIDESGLTNQIAIDCEMVGVEVGVKKDMLARVSIVNFHGNCIYDTFVKPVEPVIDYRTHVSGVRPENLENAPDFATVQKKVADILKDRILVGHGLKNDLAVLFLSHPRNLIRDTTKYERFRQGSTPALRKLAKQYLGVTIQDGEHSSVQDALAAMQLYKMFKKDWEASLNKKRKRHVKEKKVVNLQATVTQAMSLMDV